MGRKLFSDKGPRPTAQDFADQRERTKRMQEFREREQRELEQYYAAVRAGDDKLAAQIALARRDRALSGAERNGQAGVPESPSGSATDADEGASLADRAILERARESSADVRAAAEPGSLEAGGYGDD
jgi:hypothetical protein